MQQYQKIWYLGGQPSHVWSCPDFLNFWVCFHSCPRHPFDQSWDGATRQRWEGEEMEGGQHAPPCFSVCCWHIPPQNSAGPCQELLSGGP